MAREHIRKRVNIDIKVRYFQDDRRTKEVLRFLKAFTINPVSKRQG